MATAVPLAAQYEDVLGQAQLEYNTARLEFEARTAEWDAQNQRWQTTRAEIDAARRAGNRDREDAAYAIALLQGQELTRLKNRVDIAAAALEEKRRALERALDLRRDALAVQWANSTPAQRVTLDVSIRGLEREYDELQADRTSTLSTRLVFWPTVQRDPRDGPAQINSKLQLLDREMTSAVSHREWVETEITRVQNRIDLNRRSADSRAQRDLFDAATPPVSSANRGGGAPEIPLSERPLEEQLEVLRENRAQLDLMIEELRARSAVFRGLLTTMGGAGGAP